MAHTLFGRNEQKKKNKGTFKQMMQIWILVKLQMVLELNNDDDMY